MEKPAFNLAILQGSFFHRALIPLAGIILVVFAGLFLLLPRIKQINQARKDNQRLINEKEEFLQKAQLIASLDEERLRESAKLTTLAVPKEKEVSLILYALSDPARRNNFYTDQLEFNLGEVSPADKESEEGEKKEPVKKKPAEKELIEAVPVKMTLIGPKNKLLDLINALEKTLPLISLKEVRARFSGGQTTVDLSLSLFLSAQQAVYSPEKITLADLSLSSQEEELLAQLRDFQSSISVVRLIEEGDFSSTTSFGRENPFVLGR